MPRATRGSTSSRASRQRATPVAAEDGWWRSGARAAKVEDGRLRLDDGPAVDVDLVRAACAAAWAAVDAGEALDAASVPDLVVDAPAGDGTDDGAVHGAPVRDR